MNPFIVRDSGVDTVEGQVSGSRAIRLAQEREKASKAAAAAALSFSRAKTCVKIDDKFNKAIIDVVSNAGLHDPNGPEAKGSMGPSEAEMESAQSKVNASQKKKRNAMLSFADDDEECEASEALPLKKKNIIVPSKFSRYSSSSAAAASCCCFSAAHATPCSKLENCSQKFKKPKKKNN